MKLPNSIFLAMAFLVTLALPFTLSGCGSNDSFVVTDQGLFQGGQPSNEQIFGTVFLSQTASSAEVQVLPSDSDTPVASFRTNASGIFVIPRGTPLPAQFRLSAMTPEGVRIERFVEAAPYPHLFINGISTIVSRYKQSHPELTLAQIESKVQTGLLGGSTAMYGTNDTEASPFSPSRFLAEGRAAGGVETYVDQLVQGLENGQTFNLRGGHKNGSFMALYRNYSDIQKRSDILAQVGEVFGSVGFWLIDQTAGKIFDEASYRLTGKINSAAGTSFGDAGSFQEVSEEIGVVEQTILTFQNQVTNTYLQSTQARISAKLATDVQNIGTATTATQNTANAARALYASQPDVDNHGPSQPPQEVTAAVTALDFLTTTTALADFNKAFTSTNSTDNLFLAANAAASGSGTASANNSPPASGTAPSGSINHTSSPNYDLYGLRHDLITDPLVSNYGDSLGSLTQLANLISEAANLSVLPTPLGDAPGFAPPSFALNQAVENITDLYGKVAHTGLGIVAQPVGTNLVLIDCENRLMWYLQTNLCKYDIAQNGLIGLSVNGWGYPSGVSAPSQVGSSVTNDLLNFKRPSDMRGWRVPEVSELQKLRAQVVDAGGGTSSDSDIVAGLQNLGFTGLSALSDHSNFKKFWYNGAVTQTQEDKENNLYAVFQYFDMEKNAVTFGADATFFDPREDPLYTAIYVRTLNFTDSNYFGDTTQQIYKAYGQAPTSLTGIATVIGDPNQATIIEYSNISGYHPNIPATPFNQIQDWLIWSVELPSPNNNTAGLTADDIAFITYAPNNNATPGASTRPRLVFKRPGTVVMRGTVHDPGNTNPTTINFTQTSNVKPRLTAIGVTPQNVAFQALPNSSESERYYCTGYLANGLTVDLTTLVQWDVVSAYASGDEGWIVDNTSPFQGLLQFGNPSTLLPVNTLRATYTNGTDSNQPFSDGGQSFSDEASFAVPTRN